LQVKLPCQYVFGARPEVRESAATSTQIFDQLTP
jgi:hypothetical protein